LVRLRKTEEQIERDIAEAASRTAKVGAAVTLSDVQAAIPRDAALVEIVRYTPVDPGPPRLWSADRYVAYALFSTGDPVWEDLGEVSDIDRLCLQLQASMRNPANGSQTSSISRQLDEMVVRPIRKHLGSIVEVFLSPDGQLSVIPFAALVDEHGQFLLQRYQFTYLSSGRDLVRLTTKRKARPGTVVIANPDFGQPRPGSKVVYVPLPATAREADVLKSLRPGTVVYDGRNATKVALAEIKGPQVLHIATHGFFVPDSPQKPVANPTTISSAAPTDDPMLRSGLVFAGANETGDEAIATAAEIADLDLSGTELVVLSACETGIGNATYGNAVAGLRRAITIAGARSQLVSLWRIHDEKTADFVAAYYELLLKGDIGRSAALRKIQLKMTEDHLGPEDWAAFILVGDNGHLH
jgi:CHAT domain-containing protein